MNNSMRQQGVLVIGLLALALAGCGGSKVLKQPKTLTLTQPLVTAADPQLEAMLDWVIIREGPGTWAKNAKWDEYLLRVKNLSDAPLFVTGAVVEDSLGTEVQTQTHRKTLVKGSKAAAKRYRSQGLKVKAGLGGVGLMAAGAGAAVAGYGVGMAALYGSAGAAGAAGAAVAALAVAPVLMVGGVVRSVNESKVAREIVARSTSLPLALAPGEQTRLVYFVPITPSPHKLTLSYEAGGRTVMLALDTEAALDGLHLRGTAASK